MPLRLVLMGTGDFALPAFTALCDSPHEVVGVFTQPDRTGRGHHHHVNVIKDLAVARGIPVFQPPRVNAPEALADLRSLNADLAVVAAYGQILSAELLGIPRLGAINLHASLLPKYRGAAPIQFAVWKGESETGVSIFQIEPKLDAGPLLGIVRTPIGPKETAGALEVRLADLAVPLTLQVVDQIERGTVRELLQDSAGVTRAPRLRKEDGLIDWTQPAAAIDWQVRAMQPWPNPYAYLHQAGQPPLRMLILEVAPSDAAKSAGDSAPAPGTVIDVDAKRLVVEAGDQTAVDLVSIRPDGKRAMSAAEFLRGRAVRAGDRFGGE